MRLFDNQPGAMHLVSLSMHLVITTLVWVVASHASSSTDRPASQRFLPLAAMLVYGLHPALVEPVAWIAAQFELLLTGATLLAFYAAIRMPPGIARALMLALLFLTAACAKETAVVFPVLVLLFDWAWWCRRNHGQRVAKLRRAFLQRNAAAAAAMFIAGLVYLCFRYQGLGHIVQSAPMYGVELSALGTLQKIPATLLGYLQIVRSQLATSMPSIRSQRQTLNVYGQTCSSSAALQPSRHCG